MYDQNNIFAKIIRKEAPAEIVYEDDHILAFHDAFPVAPTHVLVIPKGEYVDYSDFLNNSSEKDIARYFAKINEIASSLGLEKQGFRLCTNRGEKSGQRVFHFHTHILSGAKFGAPV